MGQDHTAPSNMPHPTMLETNQYADSFLRLCCIADGIQVRLFSMRCLEAQEEQLPCQDYAIVAYRQDQASLVFCVSDGVGGSYQGDFAAYYLAHCLIDWLQALPDLHSDLQEAATELEKQLHFWQETGQAELQNRGQPENTPEFLKEILKEQQETYGSETVFFGGRIDYRSPSSEAQQAWALFCWMGNVSTQLFFTPEKYALLGGDFGGEQDRNRWSTRYGPRGILTCLTMNLDMVERLIIHTDGLDKISMELASLDDDALQARTRGILQSPANDDMTMLDIQW